MNQMEPISGVDIQLYAKLCALMKDTNYDESKEIAIAAEHGVGADAWRAAKKGWTERMAHGAPAQGQVAQAFMPVYQATLAEMRGGGEPMTLEQFARITQEMGMERDEAGAKRPPETILSRYALSLNDWAEANSYWTPRVNDPNDVTMRQRWATLVQQEADRILGIDRGGEESAPTHAAKSSESSGGGFWSFLKRWL